MNFNKFLFLKTIGPLLLIFAFLCILALLVAIICCMTKLAIILGISAVVLGLIGLAIEFLEEDEE